MKPKASTQILLAMILGVILGLLLGHFNTAPKYEDTTYAKIAAGALAQLDFVGSMFIRLLKMIIIPLIVASLVSGVASLGDARSLGRLGGKTFLYYMCTTVIAVVVGLVLVNVVRPGDRFDPERAPRTTMSTESEPPSIMSVLEDIVPENIVDAMARSNVLSVIFFSILLGAAIISVGDKARPLAAFFESLNTVVMKIVHWIMALAPIGVFALMGRMVGTLGLSVMKPLGFHMITVILGLAIHAFVVLPLLLRFFAKYSPLRFARNMFSAVLTAFSTASSSATLPITMECVEKNAGVSNRVASFVLPLGATINMDGTALYEAVAAMFIAQAYAYDLGLGQQLVIVLTATLASIGAAAIPSAGLVTMVIVLRSVNLPMEGIGMIWAVDRILDMFRTAVNVWGDSCGSAVVARLEGEQLNT
ncbi:MAG: dicarboxylate/amino acid:cation symporter [Planctomycetota bacterium]